MKKKRTSSNIILIAIVVVLVLLSVASFILYQNNIRNILAKKSKDDMKKSTDQGIILTNSLIDNYFSELDTIAIFCGVNTGINDTYEHQTDDDVLFSLAQILFHCFRETDIIARFGGDEFFVWIKDLPTLKVVRQKAEMRCNITAAGPNIPISLSIGIA
ncbi:GGDEF domain-containing protein [Eubacterium maltosivorans]|uniref:GGDEF domain-containing protein n=1 Tax=Eubacterium maltosivorans TaxID=2041044 RepID=UPI003A959785